MVTVADRNVELHALLPGDIRARLDADQVLWLEQRLERRRRDVAFAYRVSTALFGNRFYIAVLAGREQRSSKRVSDEGLKRSFATVAFEIGIVCLTATCMVATLAGFGLGLIWLLDHTLGITNLPDYLDKLFH